MLTQPRLVVTMALGRCNGCDHDSDDEEYADEGGRVSANCVGLIYE